MDLNTTDLNTMDLDSSETSLDHANRIRRNVFLRNIYLENYEFFRSEIEQGPKGALIELGSGGGFIDEIIPEVITSDLVPLPTTKIAFSGLELPFAGNSVAAIMMMNVLHHLQDVALFLAEADRCLCVGGKIIMIEPAHTIFSRLIYTFLHHEPFQPKQKGWKLPSGGRLSMSNQALPWIVFQRDIDEFYSRFPNFRLTRYENFMPFRYLLSGGVSRNAFLPVWAYPIVMLSEKVLCPFNNHIGLFVKIVVEKRA